MKTINVTFSDEEHGFLVLMKGISSWHDFIIQLAGDLIVFDSVLANIQEVYAALPPELSEQLREINRMKTPERLRQIWDDLQEGA